MENDDDDKKKENPFAGFEEFIQSHNIHIHKKPSFDKNDEGKIQSFLEHNFLRLTKFSNFFQHKLPMIKKYDQSNTMINKLEDENKLLREYITDRVKRRDSFMNEALKNIFNTHFKKPL